MLKPYTELYFRFGEAFDKLFGGNTLRKLEENEKTGEK